MQPKPIQKKNSYLQKNIYLSYSINHRIVDYKNLTEIEAILRNEDSKFWESAQQKLQGKECFN